MPSSVRWPRLAAGVALLFVLGVWGGDWYRIAAHVLTRPSSETVREWMASGQVDRVAGLIGGIRDRERNCEIATSLALEMVQTRSPAIDSLGLTACGGVTRAAFFSSFVSAGRSPSLRLLAIALDAEDHARTRMALQIAGDDAASLVAEAFEYYIVERGRSDKGVRDFCGIIGLVDFYGEDSQRMCDAATDIPEMVAGDLGLRLVELDFSSVRSFENSLLLTAAGASKYGPMRDEVVAFYNQHRDPSGVLQPTVGAIAECRALEERIAALQRDVQRIDTEIGLHDEDRGKHPYGLLQGKMEREENTRVYQIADAHWKWESMGFSVGVLRTSLTTFASRGHFEVKAQLKDTLMTKIDGFTKTVPIYHELSAHQFERLQAEDAAIAAKRETLAVAQFTVRVLEGRALRVWDAVGEALRTCTMSDSATIQCTGLGGEMESVGRAEATAERLLSRRPYLLREISDLDTELKQLHKEKMSGGYREMQDAYRRIEVAETKRRKMSGELQNLTTNPWLGL